MSNTQSFYRTIVASYHLLPSFSFRQPIRKYSLSQLTNISVSLSSSMKNHTIIIVICSITLIMSFVSTALIITEIVLGYSGFPEINGNSKVITLEEGCQENYFKIRYNQTIALSLKVSFIFTWVSFVSSLVVFVITMCLLNGCRWSEGNPADETRIDELQSHYYENTETIQRYHPKTIHIVFLYIFIVLVVITSSLNFNFYLQIIIQANTSTCQINHKQKEIFALSLLNLALLVLSLVCLAFLLVVSYRHKKRMEMLDEENRSQSYQQQVDRIIRQIPQSQRRVFHQQSEKRQNRQQQKANSSPQEIPIPQTSNHIRQSIRIQEIPKVHSIIYRADPSLMLQSINQRRQ